MVLEIHHHGIHLLLQQSLVEMSKAMFSPLFGPFVLPFCWEAAYVYIMLPHVLREVSVEVDLGFVALREQSQEQHMMIMNCCFQLIQAPKYTIPQEQELKHFPCQPEEGTVFRKHMHGVSNNCHEQCQLGCC